MSTSTIFVIAASLVTTAACTTDPAVTTFVGRTSDTDIFVALSTDGAKTAAYLCDGDPRANTPDVSPGVAAWFSTDARDTGSGIDITTDKAGIHVAFGDTAVGTVSLAGATFTFDLPSTETAVEAGSDAGFYIGDELVDGKRVLGGWIVLADGQQRGAVGFDGGGGIGKTVTGLALAPRTGAITVSGIGLLRVNPINPRSFDGGGGIGKLPTMGLR